MSDQSLAVQQPEPLALVNRPSIHLPTVPSIAEIEAIKEICKVAAYSNFVSTNAPMSNMTQRTADAFFVAMYGRELGIPIMTSLRTIYVIDGKPACSGQALLSLVKRGGVLVELPDPADITNRATVRIKRPEATTFSQYSYTEEMADAAGLLGRGNWKKHKREMLMWRAVSLAVRFEAPDIAGGLYTIEELSPDTPVDEMGIPVSSIVVVQESTPVAPTMFDEPLVSAEPVSEVVEQKPITTTPLGQQSAAHVRPATDTWERVEPTAPVNEAFVAQEAAKAVDNKVEATEPDPLANLKEVLAADNRDYTAAERKQLDDDFAREIYKKTDAEDAGEAIPDALDNLRAMNEEFDAVRTGEPEQPALGLVDKSEAPTHKWDVADVKTYAIVLKGYVKVSAHFDNLIADLYKRERINDSTTTEGVIAEIEAHYADGHHLKEKKKKAS